MRPSRAHNDPALSARRSLSSSATTCTSDAAVGRLVHAWRIRALLTQEELAARAGLSARTIRRLERARSPARPRLTSLRLLAEALNLDDAERTALASLSHGSRPAEPPAGPLAHLVVAAPGRSPEPERRPW